MNKRKTIRLKASLKTLQVIRLKESLKVLQKAKNWSISRRQKKEETKDHTSLKVAERPAQLIKFSISRSVISD